MSVIVPAPVRRSVAVHAPQANATRDAPEGDRLTTASRVPDMNVLRRLPVELERARLGTAR